MTLLVLAICYKLTAPSGTYSAESVVMTRFVAVFVFKLSLTGIHAIVSDFP